MPFYLFFEECSPTKIDYRKKGTLILTSLLEDPSGWLVFSRLDSPKGRTCFSFDTTPKRVILQKRRHPNVAFCLFASDHVSKVNAPRQSLSKCETPIWGRPTANPCAPTCQRPGRVGRKCEVLPSGSLF